MVINALLKPIIIVLTLPFTIITLGLFIFIINGLMLMLTAELSGGRIVVDGLWWAVLGGIVMGVISMIVEAMFKAFGWSEEKRERRSD